MTRREVQEKSVKKCDHTSVGIHVWRDCKLLLIERRKFPFGFAPPAGHVDDRPSFEAAAEEELKEEVGLQVKSLRLIFEGKKDNPCRRESGTWHYWKIYNGEVEGEVQRSSEETKQAGWCSKEEIDNLAKRTEQYLEGKVSEEEWQKSPGLEPVWYQWMKELKII